MTSRKANPVRHYMALLATVLGIVSPFFAYFIATKVAQAQVQWELSDMQKHYPEVVQEIKDINAKVRTIELDVRELLTIIRGEASEGLGPQLEVFAPNYSKE